jgi:alpha-galactosidase
VLVKPLSGGGAAVALFNSDDEPADIATGAAAVGLAGACYTVRDLWSHTETTTTGDIRRTVAPHDVAMLRVWSTCR